MTNGLRRAAACVAACAALLAGCEPAQIAPKAAKKADAKPWEGAPDSPYVLPTWKVGDRAGWEEQLRRRAQSQNEYVRIGVGRSSDQ